MIGRAVVGRLLDVGAVVRIVSLDHLTVDPRAEHVYGDLTDFAFCQRVLEGCEFLCHVAGIKGSLEVTKSRPASFFVPLLQMNTNVLEAARRQNVRRLVYTSSIGAYPSGEVFVEREGLDDGPPMDTYPGWAKRMAELQIQAYREQYGIDTFAVVRPCNVYGPGDNFDPANAMVIPSLMTKVLAAERPVRVWGDGTAVRDFAFADDVAEGILLALVKGTAGHYVNLGSGTGVTIRELVETLHRIVPFEVEFDVTRPGGFPRRVMDIRLAREWLGWRPETALEQGLRATWEWLVAHQAECIRRKNYFAEAD